MFRDPKPDTCLQQRVDDYLAHYSNGTNSFVQTAETAEAEAEMSEYLLRRAEEELQKAQSHVNEVKQKILELRSANQPDPGEDCYV